MQYSNKRKYLNCHAIILIFISHSSTDSHAFTLHSLFTEKLTETISRFIIVIVTCKKKISIKLLKYKKMYNIR